MRTSTKVFLASIGALVLYGGIVTFMLISTRANNDTLEGRLREQAAIHTDQLERIGRVIDEQCLGLERTLGDVQNVEARITKLTAGVDKVEGKLIAASERAKLSTRLVQAIRDTMAGLFPIVRSLYEQVTTARTGSATLENRNVGP